MSFYSSEDPVIIYSRPQSHNMMYTLLCDKVYVRISVSVLQYMMSCHSNSL